MSARHLLCLTHGDKTRESIWSTFDDVEDYREREWAIPSRVGLHCCKGTFQSIYKGVWLGLTSPFESNSLCLINQPDIIFVLKILHVLQISNEGPHIHAWYTIYLLIDRFPCMAYTTASWHDDATCGWDGVSNWQFGRHRSFPLRNEYSLYSSLTRDSTEWIFTYNRKATVGFLRLFKLFGEPGCLHYQISTCNSLLM